MNRKGAVSVLELLEGNDQWSQYSNMYDQFRISGVRAQFEVVGVSDPPGINTSTTAYSFASALDRNGVVLNDNTASVTFPQFEGMSSYLPATYYKNNRFRQVRQFFPSTIMERSQYLSTAAPDAFVPSNSQTQFNPWIYFGVSRLVGTINAA